MSTTHINKITEIARSTGDWDLEQLAGEVRFTRRDVTVGDGYPHLVVAQHSPDGVTEGGYSENLYPEAWQLSATASELGTRTIIGVLANVGNPFRYKRFYEAWASRNPASLSEKLLAVKVGVSERQIRNSRINGYMTGYLADLLSVKGIGIHPSNVFGFEGWVEHDSKGAWPAPRKPR